MLQNRIPKRRYVAQLFEIIFGSFFEAASGQASDPQNHHQIAQNTISESLCSCTSALLQHTFCLARGIQGESHCNNSRLALYLPSLGKVKMPTQYPQIVWGNCLGVRR